MQSLSVMRYTMVIVVVVLGWTAGCGEDAGDEAAVERSAAALASTADFALIADIGYSAPRFLANLPRRTQLINAIRRGLERLTGQAPCVTIESDEANFVNAIFDQCGSGDVPVDGIIRAAIDIETGPCDSGDDCPLAVNYIFDPVDFVTSGSRLNGSFSVRDPVDNTEPMSSSGTWTLTGPAGGELGLHTDASWLRDRLCVEMSWQATLTLNQEARDAIGTEIDTMSALAEDVSRCFARCPTRGDMDISFGKGELLRVSYQGDTNPQVIGPRGRVFDAQLDCPQASAGE